MKIAELSRRSGVSAATIKYYVREGLLPPGDLVKPNQAEYSLEHLRRLRLVRALVQVGGVSISTAQDVLAVVASDEPVFRAFGAAQKATSASYSADAPSDEALAFVDRLIDGWRVAEDNPGRLEAARIWMTVQLLGSPAEGAVDTDWFEAYARAALQVARADVEELDRRPGREAKAEMVVIGTALGDRLFGALRRAAGEHLAGKHYRVEGRPTPAK